MLLHVSAETRSHHQGKYTKFVVSCEYITWSQVEIKCTFQSKLQYLSVLSFRASYINKWKHQLDATVLVFISPQSSTLHVSGVTSTHHQELQSCTIRYGITWSRYRPVDVESSANRVLCVCSPCTSVYRAGRSRISKWGKGLLVSLCVWVPHVSV